MLAIKQTLYRTSGESPIVDALVRAAEAGKQVVVLVEIKARFDEERNIALGTHAGAGRLSCRLRRGRAEDARQAAAWWSREEQGRIRRYVHVGTGNYNSITARIYEDVGLFTADASASARTSSSLFNYLTGTHADPQYRSLIVAPHAMRNQLIEMIEREARHASEGQPALSASR